MSTFTPAGWYDDGHGALRWWDGTQWTEHTHLVEAPDPSASAPAEGPAVEASVVESPAVGTPAAEIDAAATPATETPERAPVDDAPEPAPSEPVVPAAPQSHAPYIEPSPVAVPPVPSAPGGYAPVYPGHDPAAVHAVAAPAVDPAGATYAIAAAPPKKSRIWILFVVLGVIVVGMIVAAALVIPRAVGDLVDSARDRSDSPVIPSEPGDSGEVEIPALPGELVDGPEADAAEAVVLAYDDAWNTGDCAAYQATLSPEMLEYAAWSCDEFVVESQFFVDSLDDYEVTIISTTRDGDDLIVSTLETFMQVTDVDGIPLDVPQPGSTRWEYTLIAVDGGWAIDDMIEP